MVATVFAVITGKEDRAMAAKRKPAKRLVRDNRLSNAARAAGFVMATPDDEGGDLAGQFRDGVPKPQAVPLLIESSGWKVASPQRALVVGPARPASLYHMFLNWVVSLTGRAPA